MEQQLGSFFVIRRNQYIEIVKPTGNVNQFEDGENTTVLFKVLCIHGKYFIYHKDDLADDSFCDTTHMSHFILKNHKKSKLKKLAGKPSQEFGKESDKINYHKLKLGDVVKFGRISYVVSDLYLPE